MKNIKVFGTGCANCKITMELIEDAAKDKGVEIKLEKIEQIQDIMAYGVMSTPRRGGGWQSGASRGRAEPRQDRRVV